MFFLQRTHKVYTVGYGSNTFKSLPVES